MTLTFEQWQFADVKLSEIRCRGTHRLLVDRPILLSTAALAHQVSTVVNLN